MSMEIFDVVNERDEVIGRRPRQEVHALGLKHRAVHVFVFNGRGEIFLQKRSMAKDMYPGAWDSSAAGHLDAGETYDACAVRELKEEIGVAVAQTPERLFKADACEETGWEFVWVYKLSHEGPFALHPEEIERGEWIEPGKLSRWMAERPEDFARSFVFLWDEYLRRSSARSEP